MNSAPREPFRAKNFSVTTVQAITQLHLAGGLRAPMHSRGLWSLGPVLAEQTVKEFTPRPIRQINGIATEIGSTIFGGDDITGVGTPLLSRNWTPLDGPDRNWPQPADKWRAIEGNAADAGDGAYAELAGHIAFSLGAAGIRLRDASDRYNDQLMAAIAAKKKTGDRFGNLPLSDLQLAFHSVLSELASSRDYFAKMLAITFGAPIRIDSFARLKDWLDAPARASLCATPIVADMLCAYDSKSPDPWLFELTEYRNLFLHRKPIGQSGADYLQYHECHYQGLIIPIINMPLGDDDPFAPKQDALLRFLRIYRLMTNLLNRGADSARYAATFPSIVIE